MVPFYVYLLITLGFGSASAGTATLGAVMARSSYLSAIIDCIGKCVVGTGLYLIAFQRMQPVQRDASAEPGAVAE